MCVLLDADKRQKIRATRAYNILALTHCYKKAYCVLLVKSFTVYFFVTVNSQAIFKTLVSLTRYFFASEVNDRNLIKRGEKLIYHFPGKI